MLARICILLARGKNNQTFFFLYSKSIAKIMKISNEFFLILLQHPYPSEDQKKQLAQDTGLTILQVNNW